MQRITFPNDIKCVFLGSLFAGSWLGDRFLRQLVARSYRGRFLHWKRKRKRTTRCGFFRHARLWPFLHQYGMGHAMVHGFTGKFDEASSSFIIIHTLFDRYRRFRAPSEGCRMRCSVARMSPEYRLRVIIHPSLLVLIDPSVTLSETRLFGSVRHLLPIPLFPFVDAIIALRVSPLPLGT